MQKHIVLFFFTLLFGLCHAQQVAIEYFCFPETPKKFRVQAYLRINEYPKGGNLSASLLVENEESQGIVFGENYTFPLEGESALFPLPFVLENGTYTAQWVVRSEAQDTLLKEAQIWSDSSLIAVDSSVRISSLLFLDSTLSNPLSLPSGRIGRYTPIPKRKREKQFSPPSDTLWQAFYAIEAVKKAKFFTESFLAKKGKSTPLVGTYHFEKVIPNARKTYLRSLSVQALPSGNYDWIVTILDSSKTQVYSQRKTIQNISFRKETTPVEEEVNELQKQQGLDAVQERYFPKKDINRLHEVIAATAIRYPNYRGSAENRIALEGTFREKLTYLLSLWDSGDTPDQGMGELEDFLRLLREINSKYRDGQGQGYRSERGKMVLKYGKPKDVEYSPEEGRYIPYEVWFWDRAINGEENRFALFWDFNRTSDFRILHSTFRNETQNLLWRRDLIVDPNSILLQNLP